MSDRELLEYAAKAAGIEIEWTSPYVATGDFAQVPNWNPLTDDGDALRLAVKLELAIYHRDYYVQVLHRDHRWEFELPVKDAREAATRRAIVRAAAEIGKHARDN